MHNDFHIGTGAESCGIHTCVPKHSVWCLVFFTLESDDFSVYILLWTTRFSSQHICLQYITKLHFSMCSPWIRISVVSFESKGSGNALLPLYIAINTYSLEQTVQSSASVFRKGNVWWLILIQALTSLLRSVSSSLNENLIAFFSK